MGNSTISMAIFNCYVGSPEGTYLKRHLESNKLSCTFSLNAVSTCIYTWFGCFFLLRQRMTQSQVPGTDFAEAQLLQCLVMGRSAEVEIGSTRKALSPRDDGGGAAHTTDDCWCWRNGPFFVYPLKKTHGFHDLFFGCWIIFLYCIILDMGVSINEGYP